MDLSSLEMLPTCTFFPRDYMQQYKQQVKELMKRMERLLEEEEALETDKDAVDHSIQVIALSSETVWQNLAALQDCHVLVDETLALFKLKIQESVALVTADPSVLERMSSIPISEEYSSSDDMDETDEVAFQDVEPVKGRKAAVALNNDVTERVYQALQNEEKFKQFKANALAFGMGNTIPETFYTYLAHEIPAPVLDSIVVDFARLLPQVGLRVPLLKAHYDHMKNHLARPSIAVFRNKSYSRAVTLRTSTSSSVDEAGSSNEEDEEYPSTIRLRSFNHLVFVIHGIGQHIDFRDGEFKSWNGETGIEGGNHAFRDIFRTMLETTFQNIPMALEMQSIEWHEDLHEPTGLDNIFDLISPEGASAYVLDHFRVGVIYQKTRIREFNKETFMDVLYYLSPRYGQLIVDSVTKQLNEKYRVFINEHPGWDGKVSIFAHSLGSMISYDILTHKSGEIASNGVRFPGLEFEVDNFFGVG
ncbi:hypothetical protein DD238_002859 [Peronospora effusa]|uniref:ZNF598/HEL2 PAH domain-containing protein n=1 Tax=Peronospora effusa TaxID=542832 RepID=A0A3M6VKV1_9STRA|nr:hypothetical protein DD238_002859 [Peronospora effusa]RQM12171.1 hypothetical protein DD237_002818 [Peronospora effusa]